MSNDLKIINHRFIFSTFNKKIVFILLHNIKTSITINFEINRHSKTSTDIKHIDFHFNFNNLLIKNRLSMIRSKINHRLIKKTRTIRRILKIIHRIKIKMFIDHINRKAIINRHRLAIINLLISFDRDIKISNVNLIKIKISISIITNIVFNTRTMKNHLNKKSIIKLMTTSFRKNEKLRFLISKVLINRKAIMINRKQLISKKN